MHPPSLRDELLALDRAHVWPPYTAPETRERGRLLAIASAEGVWLEDLDGRRYLDANASWWVSALGHRHPRLVRALVAQAERLPHCALAGVTHEPAARLAAELCAAAPPGLTRVFYSDDGSTAVETALKIALQYWHQNGRPSRRRFLALSSAFHGDTAGAMSVGGVEVFRRAFGPMLFDVVRAPPGDAPSRWDAVVDGIEAELLRCGDELAAVVVEPIVQAAAGMRLWRTDHLSRLREAATRADVFLIADEVFTGLGRTGALWASGLAGITPDLLCTAKALSGGLLPFAATLATERIYDGFRGGRGRALLHGHSYTGNPLGAAVAREVLAVLRDERVLEALPPKAAQIAAAFAALEAAGLGTGARSVGMVGAIDVGARGYSGEQGWRVYEAALERGLYARPLGDTVYVCPPLVIGAEELGELLARLADAVRAAARP